LEELSAAITFGSEADDFANAGFKAPSKLDGIGVGRKYVL
jgi:hypothetical protein